MIDGAQQLPALVRRQPCGVAELFEDVVARHHLVAQGALVTGRAMVGLELREGALHDFERRVVLEVIDQVGREVVRRSKRRVQVRRRRERDAPDVAERHLVGETDDGVTLVVQSSSTGATGHLGELAAGEELATGVGVLGELAPAPRSAPAC